MWQDAIATLVAVSALGLLGWRWYRARTSPSGACPNCASGDACAEASARKAPADGSAPRPVTFYAPTASSTTTASRSSARR